MPEGKLTAILKHIVFYGVKLWAVNQQNAEDVQLRRQRLQLPVDWNTTIKLKVVKLGAFTKSRGFLEMIKKYWFLLSTAQERTNANAKLGDAHFALPLEIYNSMTHHLFWASIHYKIVSSKLISCFSVDKAAPLTPPPSEGRPFIDAEKIIWKKCRKLCVTEWKWTWASVAVWNVTKMIYFCNKFWIALPS